MSFSPPTIVLASSSLYRKGLLSKILKNFETSNPDIDESHTDRENPEELVSRLAKSKAKVLAAHRENALIIGSDQLAVIDNQILGKPGNRDRAIEQLTLCKGRTVSFLTGLCLFDTRDQSYQEIIDRVEVKFRALTRAEIENYIDREKPFDCAGSFKCEGLGITLFESIKSEDPNSLIGLPLIQLNNMLIRAGINPLLIEG